MRVDLFACGGVVLRCLARQAPPGGGLCQPVAVTVHAQDVDVVGEPVQQGAGPDERRGPSLFIVDLVVSPGKDPKQVEKLVYDELERIKNEGVTDAEIQKVRMEVKRGKVEQLEGTLYRAQTLGQNAVFYNDPNVINTGNDKLMAVTKDQIQKAARTYLTEANRTVLLTVPKQEAGAGK